MITLTDITKTYHMGDSELKALDGVSLRIESGEFVAIMGPSGSGKSTLMHVLGLLDVPDGGKYELFGEAVERLDENSQARLRSRRIGFIFQQFNLLARTSAEANVGLPLIYSTGRHDKARSEELLRRVGLADRTHHRPNELSGGQQQRVAIARALTNAPDLILADEPTGNLDSASEKDILGILRDLNDQGITVIIVTHEPEIAKHVKRVIRMRDGHVQSDELNPNYPKSLSENPKNAALAALPPPARGLVRFLSETAAYAGQALRSLRANKIRAFLSMLGILIGVGAVIAMLALGRGASQQVQAQLASLGSNLLVLRPGSRKDSGVQLGAGAATRFTVEDARAIASDVPGIARTSPAVSGRAQLVAGDKNWNSQVQGATPGYAPMKNAVPTIGRFFTEDEDKRRERVAVLGKTVVTNLFGDDNPIGAMIKINRVSFQVIGVLPEKGANGFGDQDDIVIIPITTAMRRLLGKDFVDSIDVEVQSPDLMGAVQDRIRTLINMRHRLPQDDDSSFQIRNMADIQEALSSTSRVMGLLLAVIASISLVVGGIGIMNIMLVSVAERTREIGLRKALGATRGNILAQFLVESVVISALGGVFGIVAGWGAAVGMSQLAGWPVMVAADSIVLATAFSVGIGLVFGLWPARTAAVLHPIDALRHE